MFKLGCDLLFKNGKVESRTATWCVSKWVGGECKEKPRNHCLKSKMSVNRVLCSSTSSICEMSWKNWTVYLVLMLLYVCSLMILPNPVEESPPLEVQLDAKCVWTPRRHLRNEQEGVRTVVKISLGTETKKDHLNSTWMQNLFPHQMNSKWHWKSIFLIFAARHSYASKFRSTLTKLKSQCLHNTRKELQPL